MACPPTPSFDIQEQRARIWRSLEETEKFGTEQKKLMSEAAKLQAEAAKLERDGALAPWQIVAASAAGGAALVGAGIALAKLFLP